ncbi:MAG: hypothetical protein GXP54_03665, partial [Deltaproteobacteria bacterium]|nr:hypothetical protein [Deltaproteobacteria bacterium]
MRRSPGFAVGLMAVVVCLAAGTGCRKGTPTTCKGWVKLLRSPVRARDAIKNLGDLHCKNNVGDLEEIFSTSQYKDEILQTVKAINAPKASVGILTKALTSPMTATLGAAVAEDFALPELRAPLIAILNGDKALKARENALKALAKIDKGNLGQDLDLLIKLVQTDPNTHGVQVNTQAAKMLGEIGSDKAVVPLIKGLFLRTQRGAQLYTPARKALARIGKAAVAPIMGVLSNDEAKAGNVIKELRATAKNMGLYEWQWRDGPELVQVLGDLGDPIAAPTLAASLAKQLNPPVGVDDRVLRSWQISQQNRITMCMMGLWRIGTPEVIDVLKEVVTNNDNDAKQRLDTASAIALLPGFAGVGAVLDIYKNSRDSRFRAPLIKPVTLGMDWDHLGAFQKLLKKEKSELVKSRIEGDGPDARHFKATMSALLECKKGDTDCLIAKLKSGDKVV